jgi:hypothetical protein
MDMRAVPIVLSEIYRLSHEKGQAVCLKCGGGAPIRHFRKLQRPKSVFVEAMQVQYAYCTRRFAEIVRNNAKAPALRRCMCGSHLYIPKYA